MFEQSALFPQVAATGLGLVQDHAADLGRQHIGVARLAGQHFADADLSQSRPVEGAVS
jgi:hypothetical protein